MNNTVIEEIYRTRQTLNAQGQPVKLSSSVSEKGGMFLYHLARDIKAQKTLEVGCAMGLSTLHITEALKDVPGAQHFVVDPFQTQDWQRIGLTAIKRAGVDHLVHFLEERSEVALPALLKDHEGTFDLIFVDGWHSFDQVMVDSYFALRLLKVGGILVLDDCHLGGIAKVAKCLRRFPHVRFHSQITDYPTRPLYRLGAKIMQYVPMTIDFHHNLPRRWRKLFRRPNVVALQKTGPDTRPWNWYRSI